MGHHLLPDGRFQSDKYPALAPDKIVVSFTDPRAHRGLLAVADGYEHHDPELAEDIRARVSSVKHS